jgi:hypothetical protein
LFSLGSAIQAPLEPKAQKDPLFLAEGAAINLPGAASTWS